MAKQKTITKGSLKDRFFNTLHLDTDESGATTFTTDLIDSAYTRQDRTLMVIEQIDLIVSPQVLAYLIADTDFFTVGLSLWRLTASPGVNNAAVVDQFIIDPELVASISAKYRDRMTAFTHVFTHLRGGGIPVHPSQLYWYVVGASIASAVLSDLKVHYHLEPMTDKDYAEIYERQLQAGIVAG